MLAFGDASAHGSTSGGALAISACSVMSVDVEDWFQVENLKGVIRRDSWDSRELRVERNTDRILELMSGKGVRATFFVLGWVAEACPALVRRISDSGHEVASHGYGHELVYKLSPEEFQRDVERSVRVLEDITGKAVLGFRAPSFSITDWAIDILTEIGLRYDSSAFPTMAHDRYGTLSGVNADSRVVELRPGFVEICISCLRLGKHGVPWGGGGYFRLIPYPLFKWGVQSILGAGNPYVFYIHPWEIDPQQPRVSGLSRLHYFRHYNHLERCEARFEALLGEFRWVRMCDLIGGHELDC
jgi:polysaccharide deacetylase family protein (PEP-CTERM system associated)